MENRNQNDTNRNQTQNKNSGNFAQDREKASEAGRKGGQASHSGSSNKQGNR